MANKVVRSTKNQINITPVRTLLLFCCVISLYFNSEIADPFNSAKQILLIMASAWLIGALLIQMKLKINYKPMQLQKGFIPLGFFLITGLISYAMSDTKITALFGESQRKLGLITYLGLALFMIFASIYVTVSHINLFYTYTSITLILFLIYGSLQYSGNDFIDWNNNYNSIIGTLGNPNYASAFIAMMASLIFSTIFLKSFSKFTKTLSLMLVCLSTFLIFQSDSKQGLISIAIGVGAILFVKLRTVNKLIGQIFLFTGSFFGILAVLGMLQIGPLTYFLYKDSVTLRGYYWRAGIEMFKSSPFFGVGLDRYGANFNQYKDIEFAQFRGFDLISTNAHNIPIHIFASGGLFFGMSYVILTAFIFYRALKGINKFKGDNLIFFSGIFGAWLAYQAQSIVSIENIGNAVWGWTLGGTIIALTNLNLDPQSPKTKSILALQPIFSMLFLLLSLIPVVGIYKSEQKTMDAQIIFNSNDASKIPELRNLSQEIINNSYSDPFYKLAASNFLITIGDTSDGVRSLKNILKKDSRNTQALSSLANYYESIGDFTNSINYRNKISDFDPYNCRNYLKLGVYYKKISDFNNMVKMLDKINAIAPNSEVAQTANSELKI